MKTIISLLILLATGACTSSMLVPLAFDWQTDENTALYSEYDSVKVITQSLEVKGNYMIFDVEINNRSDKQVEVLPQQFCYYASPDGFYPLDEETDAHASALYYKNRFNYKENAMSQKEVKKFFQKRANAKQGAGIALLLIGAGLVVNDMIQDADDASQYEWTPSDEKKAIKRDVLTTTGLIAIDVAGNGIGAGTAQDMEELQFLPDELLPKMVVEPGKACRGKVFFHKGEYLPYYRLIIPLGETDYVFDFRKPSSGELSRIGGGY